MRKKLFTAALTLALALSMVPAAFAAGKLTANPTNDKLTVDGVVKNPTVYKIGGSNYFQIRDVAAVLNGTEKQFYVGYLGSKVVLTPGLPYEGTGKELKGAPSGPKEAAPSGDKILLNGKELTLTAYKIGGSNYFKLRDLGEALGFTVDWEAGKGVSITTACDHVWATRHVEEVGHEESNGTHIVRHLVCACGNFDVWGDDPDYKSKYLAHYHPITGCKCFSTVWEVEKPNDPHWVVDTPAHDETYCELCGAVK